MLNFKLILVLLLTISIGWAEDSDEEKAKAWLGKTWDTVSSSVNSALTDVGDFFTNSFHDVKDLFADTKEDLVKKVDDTEKFLKAFHNKKDKLLKETKGETNEAISKVDEWWKDTKEFQKKVQTEGETNLEELKTEWKTKAQKMYDEGLDDLIELAQKAKGAGSVKIAISLLFVISIVHMFRND